MARVSEVTTPDQKQPRPGMAKTPPSATPRVAPAAAAPAEPAEPGAGRKVANALASATSALVRITGRMMGEVRDRSGAAVADFQARPEHSRWRLYTLGCYGMVVAGTLVAQLWTDNKIGAHVRVQRVDLPAVTQVFVRNDSSQAWVGVRLNLNGIYSFEADELRPGQHLMLPLTRFCIPDPEHGKPTCAPKNVIPESIAIDCDRGHFETELGSK